MHNKFSREVYSEVSIFFATGGDVKNRDQSGRSNGICKYFGEAMEFENTLEINLPCSHLKKFNNSRIH